MCQALSRIGGIYGSGGTPRRMGVTYDALKAGEDLDFAQRALAEELVLKRRNLLDRDLLLGHVVRRGDHHAVRALPCGTVTKIKNFK